MTWKLLGVLPFLWMLAAAVDVTATSAEDSPSNGIVRDGIDTQNNTREGIDDAGTVKDGIDRSHDDTGITDEGIDKGDLDDDAEHPDPPRQPQK